MRSKSPIDIELPDVALPWHQQLVMRLYLEPFVAASREPAGNRKVYETFSAKIIKLAEDIPLAQHTVPVLVPAQAGLLDDTRYWSITQTLEHLLKLDGMAKQIILKLGRGEAPRMLVTPEVVAPSPSADPEKIFSEYREFVPRHLDEIDALLAGDDSKLTEKHPLFGDFTARQWHWSLATRTSLRYRQLKNIRKGLGYDPAAERSGSAR